MIFADEISERQKYRIIEIFGRDKFFYKPTLVRIAGWETPVSLIFAKDGKITFRFKKTLLDYLTKTEAEKMDTEGELCIRYALKKYKLAVKEFSATPLTLSELNEALSGKLFDRAFPKDAEMTIFDGSDLWFPIEEDCVLVGLSDSVDDDGNGAVFCYADGSFRFGKVGFDGKFYQIENMPIAPRCTGVFSFDGTTDGEPAPDWINAEVWGGRFKFTRDYVKRPDNRCFSYDGKELSDRTIHHKNIALLNDIIKLLYKPNREGSGFPRTKIVVSENFDKFPIGDVERVAAANLAINGVLSQVAMSRFLRIKSIIEKAGLGDSFEKPMRNILSLSESKEFRSRAGAFCSKELILALEKMSGEKSSDELAAVLCDEALLRQTLTK